MAAAASPTPRRVAALKQHRVRNYLSISLSLTSSLILHFPCSVLKCSLALSMRWLGLSTIRPQVKKLQRKDRNFFFKFFYFLENNDIDFFYLSTTVPQYGRGVNLYMAH